MGTKIRVNRERMAADDPCISIHIHGLNVQYARRVDFTHDGVVVASVVQGDHTVYMEPGEAADMKVEGLEA